MYAYNDSLIPGITEPYPYLHKTKQYQEKNTDRDMARFRFGMVTNT